MFKAAVSCWRRQVLNFSHNTEVRGERSEFSAPAGGMPGMGIN